MIEVTVTAESTSLRRPTRRLIAAVRRTLERFRVRDAQINVALVGVATMRSLHRRFLGRKGTTDVLAFDLRSHSNGDGLHAGVEGEIVLCVDTAVREAQRRGHGVDAELMLYAVHATLHLLGFGDAGAAEAARMHRLEDDILAEQGIGPVYSRKPMPQGTVSA